MEERTIVNSDEEDFKRFVTQYYPQLCAFATQYTDSLEVSEDIVQDVFLRFWESKKYLSVKSYLKSYIFSSVRNASIDYIRKNNVHTFTELEEASYLKEEEVNEENLLAQHEHLYELLKQLPPQEYEVLMAIVVHNKKYKEVGEEMNISVNTVKTHLSRALKFLRAHNINLRLLFLFY
nr:RNA polymerase sigma-70 factor [uncultured Bacteroides sp.]